jgi:transposase-like protein
MRKAQPKAYSLKFREDAMRQVLAGTKPIRELAQELGVHVETLRNWRRDARIAGYGNPASARQGVEEENRELRCENARLKEERERRIQPVSATCCVGFPHRRKCDGTAWVSSSAFARGARRALDPVEDWGVAQRHQSSAAPTSWLHLHDSARPGRHCPAAT